MAAGGAGGGAGVEASGRQGSGEMHAGISGSDLTQVDRRKKGEEMEGVLVQRKRQWE